MPTLRELILSSCNMVNLSGFLLLQLGTPVIRHCANGPTGTRIPEPAKLTNLRKLTLENNTFRDIAHPKLEELEPRFSRVPYKSKSAPRLNRLHLK